MKFGLPLSLVLHTTLVFGGLVFWKNDIPDLSGVRVIPLELVTVAEVTNVKPTIKKPPEPEIKPQSDPETLVQPIKPVVPETDPDGTLLPGDDAQAETPKPTEKLPSFDLDNFSAMVDRAREDNPDTNTQRVLLSERNNPDYADVNQGGAGAGDGLTVSAPNYIRSKMKPCWPIDTGAQDYKTLRVEVRLSLDEHGEIASVRVLNSAQIIASSNNAWRAARDRVVTALRSCAPYDGLSRRNYNEWKNMKLNFQPGDS